MNERQILEPNTKDLFFLFFFLFYLYNYASRWVMADLKRLYNTRINQALCHFFLLFLLYLAAISGRDFWVSPPDFIHEGLTIPSWPFFRSHSNLLSLAPSLHPIPAVFKIFNNGATAFSSSSRSANHLVSTRGCHLTSSCWNSGVMLS